MPLRIKLFLGSMDIFLLPPLSGHTGDEKYGGVRRLKGGQKSTKNTVHRQGMF